MKKRVQPKRKIDLRECTRCENASVVKVGGVSHLKCDKIRDIVSTGKYDCPYMK